ncbi:MAG: dTDP-4-dehydrorhamnose 3,5-epimerase family protein [Thermus sp.]|uniref:dTDP-4-dehydrorhamnose 3,5-epimerase family protein n=1 Tax=Thermus TaxID=270 RepID=UPI001FAB0089|nr:dTDP-4-dehydrorhamnose 3,5-epimerase family protein [Thermus thalpophilus]
MKIPLDPEAGKALTFQRYEPGQTIAGVFRHPLRKHRAIEGWFMELARLENGEVLGLPLPFSVKQASLSYATPGRINAFHIHPKVVQDELWCVVQGTLLVWLVDLRMGSPTLGVRQRVVLSGEEPEFLHIPSGVAHGYKASPEGALLLYLMNSQFNPQDPNEGRLPWDYFGAELWQEDRG